jgi:mRNA-degrading endonuclease RelE of RelBE toxin-antitoxin system
VPGATGTAPRPARTGVGKPLKLGLEGLHSARRGDYRVIYRIDDQRRPIDVVAIEHRSDIYRPRQL